MVDSKLDSWNFPGKLASRKYLSTFDTIIMVKSKLLPDLKYLKCYTLYDLFKAKFASTNFSCS